MDNPVVWSALLLGMAVILFILEAVFPSGVMAVIAGISAVGGVVMLFEVGTTTGLLGAAISLIGLPLLLVFAFWLWPNTPIVNMLRLRTPASLPPTQPPGPGHAGAANGTDAFPAVGDTGKAVSDMRPIGICLINGRRIDCLAEGGMIQTGTEVRVTSVDGMQIKVRPMDEA